MLNTVTKWLNVFVKTSYLQALLPKIVYKVS